MATARWVRLVLGIVALSLLSACATTDQRRVGMVVMKLVYPEAKIGGRVVPERVVLERLPASYGFLIQWYFESSSAPSFAFYDNGKQSVERFATLDGLLARLEALPDGERVVWISRCGGGFSPGIPHTERSRLQELLKRKRFKPYRRSPFSDTGDLGWCICTCETKDSVLVEYE